MYHLEGTLEGHSSVGDHESHIRPTEDEEEEVLETADRESGSAVAVVGDDEHVQGQKIPEVQKG